MLKIHDQGAFGSVNARAAGNGAARGHRVSSTVIDIIAMIGDAAVIISTAFLAHLLRFGNGELPASYLYAALLLALLSVNIFRWRKLYSIETYARRMEHFLELAGSYTLSALLVVGIGFGVKTSGDFSRLWFGTWTLLALAGLLTWYFVRSAIVRAAQEKGRLRDRLLIIGSPGAAHDFTQWLDAFAPRQTNVLGVVTTGHADASQMNGHKVFVGLEALPELVERLMPDKVVLLLDWSDRSTIDACLEPLRSLALDVELVLPRVGSDWLHRPISHVGNMPTINLMRRPLSETAHVAKRIEDYVLATGLLVALLPFFLVIGALIKASSKGPIFYRQRRVGFQKREFSIFKFRTMRDEQGAAFRQATRDDDRITFVGRFLRRTSLDELPQLINVLRGEMSLVGPRPHEVSMNESYAEQVDDYLVRHKIKPGITGWAQVNGARGETRTIEDMERRIGFDLEYVDNWSVWFDIKILVRTVIFFLFHRNAY